MQLNSCVEYVQIFWWEKAKGRDTMSASIPRRWISVNQDSIYKVYLLDKEQK